MATGQTGTHNPASNGRKRKPKPFCHLKGQVVGKKGKRGFHFIILRYFPVVEDTPWLEFVGEFLPQRVGILRGKGPHAIEITAETGCITIRRIDIDSARDPSGNFYRPVG